MTIVNPSLRSGTDHLDTNAAMRAEVSNLIGVVDTAVSALNQLGITTVIELATSTVFEHANIVLTASTDPTSPFARLEVVADELLCGAATGHNIAELSGLGIEILAELADPGLATRVKDGLGVATVRDLALWPAYRVARSMLADALDVALEPLPGESPAVDPREEAGLPPIDLQPANGLYPTERAYYETLVLDQLVGLSPTKDLSTSGQLDLAAANAATTGFDQPAEGAVLRFSQSWYAQGLTLGQLLHSVALAPGESTRIAMVDWNRRTSGMT